MHGGVVYSIDAYLPLHVVGDERQVAFKSGKT